MATNIQDRKKSLTVEELRQRYNLEDISKNKKAIQVQKDSITKLDAHLEDFIDATVENLQELQDQVDGNITTWFYSGVPTLSNEPAVEWTTDEEKNRHFGDLYYDQSTGYAYRFGKQSNQYVWIKLTDSDVTEALRIANEAQDTADNKRRVFTTTPTTPYDVGDLYLYNEDLYVCSTARESGSYVSTDFEIATKYTDDTALNNFVNVTYAAAMQNLTNQIDGKISTWYYDGVPTLSNLPASAWTTDEEKQKHTGDLYYDRETGYCYMFEYENSTYKWTRIEDSSITEALAVANAAQDTADNKRRVFVVQPTPPYDIGDIWIKEDKDLYRCKTATQAGGTFNMSHWILATNYTDDTVALQAKQELDQFKTDVEETYVTNAELITTANNITGRVEETYTYITTVENTLENQIGDITTTTQVSTGKNSLYTEEAVEGNALGYLVDGTTEQQTYSGKNLFDKDNVMEGYRIGSNGLPYATTGYNLSDFIPVKPNTTYSRNVKIGGNSTVAYYDSNKTFIERLGNLDVYNFTTTSETYYIRTAIADGDLNSLMIEEGSTVTDWEPYVGGTPSPNPDYPQEVKTIPSIINLFDKDNANIINCNVNTNTISTSNNAKTLYIPITGGATYTISKIQSARFIIATTQIIPVANVSISDYIANNAGTTITVTTSSTAKYLCVYYYLNGTDTLTEQEILDSIQIEKGSVSHEYIPYGYWSKVKVIGKNMFNKNTTTPGYINANGSITNNTNYVTTDYIEIDSSKQYTKTSTNSNRNKLYDANKQLISTDISNDISGFNNAGTYSIPYANAKYIRFTIRIEQVDIDEVMFEEGNTATEYESYKENQVLIDMSKENLFDKDNPNVLNAYVEATKLSGSVNTRTIYIPITGGKTYTVSKIASMRFKLGTTADTPVLNAPIINYVAGDTSTSLTITASSTANYLCVFYYHASYDTLTEETIRNSIKIFEGNNSTPYYELCKIGDYKDTLSIDSSGNCVINKNVGKVVLNGGETGWFKSSASSSTYFVGALNGTDMTNLFKCPYGTTSTPKSNYLTYSNGSVGSDIGFRFYNQNGDLYNSLGLSLLLSEIPDLNTFKTWLSTHNTEIYYPLATPETINLQNTKIPLFEGINHVTFVDDLETDTSISLYRKTPLTGTYATVTQLKDLDTQKTTEITQIRNEMLVDLNSERLRIDSINQTIDETGVPILNTGTGYVFDSEGLKIEKTNQDVKSQLDNDGLSVKYNDADVLTARSNGVNAVNMTVNKFYVQKPIRMEKTKSISDSTSIGLGFYYVGE